MHLSPLPHVLGGIGLARGDGVASVPGKKRTLNPRPIATAGKVMESPESLCPQVVERFDRRVVIGLTQGDEQDVDAQVQTQAHHFAEPPGMVAAAKCAFIVKLGHVGHAELLPSLQSVLTSGGGGFGGMRGGVGVVAVDVDSVEGLDDFASRDRPL